MKINEYLFDRNYFPRRRKVEPISKPQFRKNDLGHKQRRFKEKRKGLRRVINTTLALALLYVACDNITFRNPFQRPLRPNVENITNQNDISLNIKMKEEYLVNEHFDYRGRITNVSDVNLILNNTSLDCLETKILDEYDNIGWKEIKNETPFIIELYSDGGYIEVETKRDTNILRVSGAKVDLTRSAKFHTKTKVPKLAIVEYWEIMEEDNRIPDYMGGVYHCYLSLKYLKSDTNKVAEFNSPEFFVPFTIADTTNVPSSVNFRLQNVKMPIRRMYGVREYVKN